MSNEINSIEYLELKGMLSKTMGMIQMLIPKKASVSYLSEHSGKSRQSIRQFVIRNYEPDKDYWVDGRKMFVSQTVAVTILTRNS